MSKVVVLGLEGENGLWVTDPEAGAVNLAKSRHAASVL